MSDTNSNAAGCGMRGKLNEERTLINTDRAEAVHHRFRQRVLANDLPVAELINPALEQTTALNIFRAQCISRHLDRAARKMQKVGQGFYTIGSSGHEGMAAVAAALRVADMAFLHYRDGAFQAMRASQAGENPIPDMLLSIASASEDPISGGRHKVLGSKSLFIPPQTSTIASHLPKAMGAAFSIHLARRRPPEHKVLADDSIVLCSFGDASANHSTAQGAINAACWASYQSIPMPLLLVCEDNGIGISVRTPKGWIAANFKQRPGLHYFHANGLNMFETYQVAQQAADYVRQYRKPAFLHVGMVRLYGHAGSDVQTVYLSQAECETWEANDPLLYSANLLIQHQRLSPAEIVALYDAIDTECTETAAQIVQRPRLSTAAEVMQSIIPPKRRCQPIIQTAPNTRQQAFGSDARVLNEPQTLARLINWTLTDLMLNAPELILAGEDIGRKGGVYGVTQRLQQRFGKERVMDTLLDEQSILGLALGMAQNGFIPIPEIQFLAYLHNAEDQLRGEAATLPFFSNGQYSNPMVVRIAGLGYQRGFGGHFHNDNSLAVLRDIPGIIVACPSNGADAAKMLRESVRLAREEQRVVVFIEPIALYTQRDLHVEKDEAWACTYPEPTQSIALGEVGIYGQGKHIAIITYANGYYLARQAEKILREQYNLELRLIDLRWLAPLPATALKTALQGVDKVLVVDECRRSGNISEALMTWLDENFAVPKARLTAEDSFIATGPAYAATLPSKESIIAAVLDLSQPT